VLNRTNTPDAGAPLSCHAVENMVCEIWSAYFNRAVAPYDDFFELGGDSIAVIETVTQAREQGLPVRSSEAMRNPTPARLAEHLTLHRMGAPDTPLSAGPLAVDLAADPGGTGGLFGAAWDEADVLPILIAGDGPEPLFVVHSDSHVEAERDAVSAWLDGRSAFGFRLPGTRGPIPPAGGVGQIADRFLTALLQRQPDGPHRLAGFGLGAAVAFDMALRLCAAGADVALLALVGPSSGKSSADLDVLLAHRWEMLAGRFAITADQTLPTIHARFREAGWYDAEVEPADLPRLQVAWAKLAQAVQEYEFTRYDGPAVLFEDGPHAHPVERAWPDESVERLRVHRLDHGIVSPLAVIRDLHVAETMRKALA
jgi:thioesterase domain-containing protein